MDSAPARKGSTPDPSRRLPFGGRLFCALLLCAACGCARPAAAPSPTPSATAASRARPGLSVAGSVLLDTWNTTLQALPDQPSLLALPWHDVRLGEVVEGDTVVLTGHYAHVRLLLPEDEFLPAFVRLARNGQVVGYAAAGPKLILEIPAGSLFPLRASPEVNPPGVRLRGLVSSVTSPAIISAAHGEIRKHYGALAARTEGPAPAETRAPARRSLGISGRDVSQLPPDARAKLGMLKNDGVFVDRVFPGTPAGRARIVAGDVILELGGRPVHDSDDLMEAVQRAPAGKPVTVVIYRYTLGTRLPVRVMLAGEAPPSPSP